MNVKENKVELDMGVFRGRKGKRRNDVIIFQIIKIKKKEQDVKKVSTL